MVEAEESPRLRPNGKMGGTSGRDGACPAGGWFSDFWRDATAGFDSFFFTSFAGLEGRDETAGFDSFFFNSFAGLEGRDGTVGFEGSTGTANDGGGTACSEAGVACPVAAVVICEMEEFERVRK